LEGIAEYKKQSTLKVTPIMIQFPYRCWKGSDFTHKLADNLEAANKAI
jgi:hypothetical protein